MTGRSMSAALPDADRDRLLKTLALFGSNHSGEVAAAAHAATRLLQARGVEWADIIPPSGRTSSTGRSRTGSGAAPSWREVAAMCERRSEWLTPWERSFVAGLPGSRTISPKQGDILARIAAKVEAAGGD